MEYNITYRQKDKGWQYIISYKDNGKWKQKSKQGFRTRRLAKVAADERLEKLKREFELQKNLNSDYKDITFEKFAKIYLENLALHSENNTIVNYKTVFKKFNKLNEIPIESIQFLDIQSCVNDMIKEGLHSNTIKEYTSKIRTVFNNAIKPYKILTKNPVDKDIKIPESKEKKKNKALNKIELNDLLNRIKPNKDYAISLIAATCGLRIGEILGLTWNDINYKHSIMNINKQWKKLKDGTFGFGNVKTKNSLRDVPIPPNTLEALKNYKKTAPTDLNNRIFLDKITKSTCVRLFYKYRKLGYDISVHDLRHTYATFLVASGLDFKTIAKLLGHSVEMTMKIYSHVTDDMMDMAIKKINSVF